MRKRLQSPQIRPHSLPLEQALPSPPDLPRVPLDGDAPLPKPPRRRAPRLGAASGRRHRRRGAAGAGGGRCGSRRCWCGRPRPSTSRSGRRTGPTPAPSWRLTCSGTSPSSPSPRSCWCSGGRGLAHAAPDLGRWLRPPVCRPELEPQAEAGERRSELGRGQVPPIRRRRAFAVRAPLDPRSGAAAARSAPLDAAGRRGTAAPAAGSWRGGPATAGRRSSLGFSFFLSQNFFANFFYCKIFFS